MRRKEFYGQHSDSWLEKKILMLALVIMGLLFAWSFVWGEGCNGDAPILAGCSKVSLRAEPCGNCPEPPDSWLVTIDHSKQIIMPNMAIIGEEGMWIPLGDYYRLHPGDNLIEYRAAKAGYVDGPTESVVLSMGTEIPPQTLGAYTISEVRGEGN